MQCLSFCLFGVYGVDDESRIQVQNNDNCKTNCPACSRVCPEAAIMFPKYKAGPINGDTVSSADLQREKMKIDISALLGGDVYAMLRTRSERAKSRFSKERDSDKALTERQKCLAKLAAAGDIPAEVLMSLPSPEEIARRAEEAKAKAAAASPLSPKLDPRQKTNRANSRQPHHHFRARRRATFEQQLTHHRDTAFRSTPALKTASPKAHSETWMLDVGS
jgi:NAD-dependent dihydropyrimidine dehydrogenase PreA subunit